MCGAFRVRKNVNGADSAMEERDDCDSFSFASLSFFAQSWDASEMLGRALIRAPPLENRCLERSPFDTFVGYSTVN